jgi:phospholipid transport system substrate-binding protein
MKSALVRFRRRDAIRLVGAAALLPLLNLPWMARSAWSAADPAAAEAAVHSLAEQIWELLGRAGLDEQGRIDAIAAALVEATDVDLLSRLALARYWQRLDDEQKERYRTLFRDVVMRSFASRLDRYAKDARGPFEERFTITSSASAGKDDVLVRSRVRPLSGDALAVDWRLREGARGPVVIDVIIEGVSLLVSQRSEFAAVIERSDMEGLLAELQARAGPTRS